MKRAPIVLTATVAGVAAVLALHPRPGTQAAVAERPLPNLAQPAGTARPTGTFLGDPVPNRYGTVQVQVAMKGGKLVDARAVQLPDGDGQSVDINRQAAPLLKQQAVAAQTAQIDGVSGATYTSDGYRQSLQAALDQAAKSPTTTGQVS